MAGIFVNYRDIDSGWAVLLDRELSRRFGSAYVFRASRSIRPGEYFPHQIMRSLGDSWVVVAIIGAGWLAAIDHDGRSSDRDEPNWVRREIAQALQAGIPVIPVILEDAALPAVTGLPTDLARLARCQYLRLRQHNDQHDLTRLIAALTELAAQSSQTRRNRPPWRQRKSRRDPLGM